MRVRIADLAAALTPVSLSAEILANSGTQFDPHAVESLVLVVARSAMLVEETLSCGEAPRRAPAAEGPVPSVEPQVAVMNPLI